MRTVVMAKGKEFKAETDGRKDKENDEKGRRQNLPRVKPEVMFISLPKQHYLTPCNLTFESICDGVCLHEN